MTYKIVITAPAEKTLDKLPVQTAQRIVSSIYQLAANPRPPGCVKLAGSNNYRIRVGDFRIIYSIEDEILTVIVLKIGNRRDVYR